MKHRCIIKERHQSQKKTDQINKPIDKSIFFLITYSKIHIKHEIQKALYEYFSADRSTFYISYDKCIDIFNSHK